ncbi:CRAL/TRIO domain-containing protein [Chloropicon primus]|uniref:CRAL/TRIO domain-containing protein n=2 Tax=Chloropicon primus TaxID=1764295 RepID=A0A5B8MZU8_9CHLO|nr:CRAL/TRIO domain-containing protein [Chloropicon primus]UPR05026.1 CRAL/TRIO domain-containing protein [Chloropicon primus]|eukprot:QDZ25831.1 CRAL/TRIO domain-containing protein [Chloropicon primus]
MAEGPSLAQEVAPPSPAMNVTCMSGKKKPKVSALVSPCFGIGKSSARISHRSENGVGADSARGADRELALKSHRLLHQQNILRKLSTSRIALLSKGRSNTDRTVQDSLREEAELEIEELETDLLERLESNIMQEMAAIERISHGSFSFLSESAETVKEEFMSKHTLRRFLIARNWDIDQATQMLMEYYRWREINPVGGIRHETIETSLAAKKVFMLKERDWNGRPVLVVVATRHIVAHQTLEETIRFVQYCTDKIMHIAMDDERGVSKMCVFVDLRNTGGHCLDKTALGTMLELMQNYFPERLGTAILWKPPTIFWLAWKLIHNFIPKETRRRMCFAYKQKDVSKFMDPSFVPECFGGTASDDILTPIEDA